MDVRRALHLIGTGALAGALLLGSSPAVSADDIRNRQWALEAFDADKIWDRSTGDGVTVAVVDVGVDASHPDLKGQVLKGKDFTKEGGSAQEDTDGHGTGVAGLIAGKGHGPGGRAGVMGLAPKAKILPIRYKHSDNEFGVSWAEGVRYAVDHGADVINISAVTTKHARDKQAIDYAIENDVVVVAGTGNNGVKERNYPAAYPGVVSVGGVDDTGAVWEDSSWGSNTTLIAPATKNVGADTTSASGYAMTSGTSDATAYVSASAALVREKHPDLTAGQVINRLIKTAKVPGPEEARNPKLPDEKFGYGVVRPYRAVTYDIPAGPKAGPLPQPEKSSGAAAGESGAAGDSSSEDSMQWMFALGPPIVVIGVALVLVVALIVVTVVLVTRRKRSTQPGAAAAPGAPPGWPGGPGPAAAPGFFPGQQPGHFPGQQPGQQMHQAPQAQQDAQGRPNHAPYPAGQFGGPPASPPPVPGQPPGQPPEGSAGPPPAQPPR